MIGMHGEALEEIKELLTNLFREVFNDDSLVLRPDLTASDVEHWDSLSHIELIVAVERQFKVRFTTAEVTSLKNVGELASLIQKKRASRS
jgi:acyl carrier protein